MSSSEGSSFSWTCPSCGRRVPHAVDTCRCGFEQPAHPAAVEAPAVLSDSTSPHRVAKNVLAVGAALAVIAGLFYGMNQRPTPVPPSAARQPSEPRPLRDAPPASTPAPAVGPLAAPPHVERSIEEPAPLQAIPVPATPAPASVPALEDLVNRVSPAVVTIQTSTGRGSGFFVTPDTVLTNVHVVASNSVVTIRRTDGATTTARVETTSPAFDIAVLKLSNPMPGQPTIAMGSAAAARVGQEVVAIGTPLGFLQNTVTRGIISGLREVDGTTMIQTDAAINPGNSGGPLLNRDGVAIGIVRSGYNGRDGLSFAVAIDHAVAVMSGHAAAAPSNASSQYKALAPNVASPLDQARIDSTNAFDQMLAQLAKRADALDDTWQSFKRSCYEGRVVGAFDHEWFAQWEPRAMRGAISPGCGANYGDIQQRSIDVRSSVRAADEAARRADIYPGVRRDLLRKYRLDSLVK